MKRTLIIASLLLYSSNPLAANWYFGAGIGTSNSLDASNNIDAQLGALASLGIPATITADKSAHAYSFLAGYIFSKHLGIEASYDYLGTYQLSSATSSFAGTVAAWEQDKVSAISISAVLSAPLRNNFSVYAKAGIAESTNDMTCSVTGSVCASNSDSKTGPVFGVGGDIGLRLSSSMRLEYDRYNSIGNNYYEYSAGDFSLYKLEFLYYF